jgi:hypothetical protein
MRLAFLSAIGCLLASTFVTSAQEKKAPLPQEALVGEWANVSKEVGKIFPGFVISQKGDVWSIEASGKGIIPEGKVTLSLLRDNPGEFKSLPNGFATWSGDNFTLHMTLRLEKDEVVAETFMIHKDKSLGPNDRTKGKFKKK